MSNVMKKAVAQAIKAAKTNGMAARRWTSSPNAGKKFIEVVVQKIHDTSK
jgi:hypothetical protein